MIINSKIKPAIIFPPIESQNGKEGSFGNETFAIAKRVLISSVSSEKYLNLLINISNI